MQVLDVGEVATITTIWYDTRGAPAEPSAITLTIIKPDGTTVTLNKSNATGTSSLQPPGTLDTWVFTYTVDQGGLWRYDVSGVVNAAPVEQPEGAFLVGVGQPAGPCDPWTTWEDVVACGGTNLDSLNAVQRENIIDTASSILYDLSDRRYAGVCEVTMSLCLACVPCCGGTWGYIGYGSGGYGGCCTCSPSDRIDLGSPVWAAWDVVIDGEAFTDYQVLNRRWLVRTDGLSWPRFSNLADPDAFRVSWAYGRPIPVGGRRAAAQLGRELALACLGSGECQLPQRITSITREGVSFAVLDPMTVVTQGRTGVYLVDLWLEADAKGRRPSPSLFAPSARRDERALI